ncbi:GIY-YIG nuclease family protein [Kitasatospora sp. NPDC091335]|uniref:GIY-YIG nuclease family protein n=1 Tax=Kitasatospora sp. NPDC091335 TaxID=3364085 RepID=UPI00381ECDBF
MPSQRKSPDRPTHGSIYTLTDPRDHRVRYVGQTEKSLQTRLAGHLNQPTNPGMRLWTLILMAQGLTPVITEVDRVRTQDLLTVEQEYIESYAAGGHLLNSPHHERHLPDLGAQYKALFVAAATEEDEAGDSGPQPVPPIVITVPGPPPRARETEEETWVRHEHAHYYSFSLGGASSRHRPLSMLRRGLGYRWSWARRLRFKLKQAARHHPWHLVVGAAAGVLAVWKVAQSQAAGELAHWGQELITGAVWPVIATVDHPVRRFILAHAQTVPAGAATLRGLWWAAGAVILFTNLLSGAWSRRLAWTAYGAATVAMVWYGSQPSDRPVTCGLTGLLWVLAFAFV